MREGHPDGQYTQALKQGDALPPAAETTTSTDDSTQEAQGGVRCSTDPTIWARQTAVDALAELAGAAAALRQGLLFAEPRSPKQMARLAKTLRQSTGALQEWMTWLEERA